MYYMQINKNFVHQVGDQRRLFVKLFYQVTKHKTIWKTCFQKTEAQYLIRL